MNNIYKRIEHQIIFLPIELTTPGLKSIYFLRWLLKNSIDIFLNLKSFTRGQY